MAHHSNSYSNSTRGRSRNPSLAAVMMFDQPAEPPWGEASPWEGNQARPSSSALMGRSFKVGGRPKAS
eukprot:gene7526-673_t